jgi:hypothetical protein
VKQARALRQSNRAKRAPSFLGTGSTVQIFRFGLSPGARAHYLRECCIYIRGGRMLFGEADSQEPYARLMMCVKKKGRSVVRAARIAR